MSVSYYVIFHKDSGTLFGFSTFIPNNVPEDYILEERMSSDYPRANSEWSTTALKFEDAKVLALTRYQFLERFTPSERISIREVSKTNSIVFDFMEMLNISQEVQLNNPLVNQGLMYLVSIGILSINRPSEILKTEI